jgi:GT2 family glycosyltransferase/glycosyltransferase involved in cell wall biosynthesis
MKKLKVSVYPLDKIFDACAHYRITSPLGHLSRQIDIIWNEDFSPKNIATFEKNAQKADIILVQRFFPSRTTANFIDYLFSLNKPVIYEIDDLLTEIPADNPNHRWSLDRRNFIYDTIKRASAVTVSTNCLKDHFAKYNKNIFILPNYIDTNIWNRGSSAKRISKKLRIGYAGSGTHYKDLQLIESALYSISAKFSNRVSFIFFGCHTEILKKLPDAIFIDHDKSYYNYSKILKKLHIDIMLVPLIDNIFNNSKSIVKWLEYSALGIPGIYSDTKPYTDVINDNSLGLLADKTTDSWITCISKMIEDQQLRDAISITAHNVVTSSYEISRYAHKWIAVYSEIFETYASKNITNLHCANPVPTTSILPLISFNIAGKRFASQYLRQVAPLLELEKKGRIKIIDGHTLLRRSGSSYSLDISSLSNKPVIFLQRDFSPYEFLFETDHTLIYDFDDNLLDLPNNHPDAQHYQKLSSLLKKYMHRFAAVIVPTENLRRACAAFNPNTQVIPNFIPFVPEQIARPEQKTRILVSGTRSHLKDAEFLVPVIESICVEFPNTVEFIFWGYCPDKLKQHRNIHFKDTFVDDYPTYLLELASLQADIGLIPLAFTWFNSFKSDIKWKEYAICNMVSIASNTDPYQTIRHGEDGFLADNSPLAWKELLIRLINDPQMRASMARAGADRVRAEFLLNDNLHFFEDVLGSPQIRATQIKPEISIIIPVFNKKELTYNCLQALFGLPSKHQYEVIVVDNASTDGTRELLCDHFPACRIVSNTENLGFAAACNQGAGAAKGHYLVFLNNDTIPLLGWLDNLVDALRRHPDAGIVGCKLLYLDETIQHCGASMNHDGTFFRHQYKFLHASHPLVNFERELDAVTAACFITPHKTFVDLGMFDTQYSNGCEDMDYCSKARQAGYKIYYTPSSVLYHLESQTPRLYKKDKENFALYISKWGAGFMKNEIDIYTEDGFWIKNGDQYSPSSNVITILKDLGLNFNPSCSTPAETFQKIVNRIFPRKIWKKIN